MLVDDKVAQTVKSLADGARIEPDALLAALLQSSEDCVKILDLEGRLLYMNEGGKRVMEIDDFDSVRNCPWADLWKDAGQASARKGLETARSGETARFLGFATTAKGTLKFWDVTVAPVLGRDGRPTHILSVSRDISQSRVDRERIESLVGESAVRQRELRESEAKFRTIADAMPQMVWSTRPDGYHDYYNARWYEFTGMPQGSTDGEEWNGMFHPEDQERAWARWRHSLETGEPYDIEYRLRHRSGAYRWTLGRALALRDEEGRITRWFGTCTDIDDAKRDAQHLGVLSHELSHRIKNMFAVIQGLIGLSGRQFPEVKEFTRGLSERVAALGRAHDLARPHSEFSQPMVGDTTLQSMLREILKPYPAMDEGRIVIDGANPAVDDRSATPLALIFHELATNATKYGALSTGEGRVAIRARSDGACTIEWSETGGPAIETPPSHEGFGTRLATISAENHLGGSIDRRWDREGLSVTIAFPETSLRRS